LKRRLLDVTPAEAGPLLSVLSARLGVSSADAEALVRRGAVYLGGRRTQEASLRLKAGDRLLVVLEESGHSVLEEGPPLSPLRVLFEDAALLAVDKPAGLPAIATPGGATSLAALASGHLGHAAGLVHRLDKGTTGLTLFGVTPLATRALAASFREGRVQKQYLAVTGPGLPEAGRVELPLSRDPSRKGRWRASARAHGVTAVTDFRRLGHSEGHAVCVLWPRTGRTHQLRAHLAALGAPLLGDILYGGAPVAARPLLHAHALHVPHPETGAALTLVAEVPEDMVRLFAEAGVRPPEGFL
jgi:23S rRNA pseudouridine1911/1915/1917 synthase